MNSHLDPVQINSVLTWFNSPLGKKIEHLENAAATPHGYEALQLYSDSLASRHPDNEYVLQAQTLISVTHVIDAGPIDARIA